MSRTTSCQQGSEKKRLKLLVGSGQIGSAKGASLSSGIVCEELEPGPVIYQVAGNVRLSMALWPYSAIDD
ncbi:MAG: hypothetical protein KC563_11080 [Nitrospira sp.]|nr:hypothetical protein [Nitrospira sp.]MCB9711017.1 hypothetical protein [Nitrospiraceae bacterium]